MSGRAQAKSAVHKRLALLRLSRLHASYIDPERFQTIMPRVPPQVSTQFLTNQRFSERVSARIAVNFPLPLLPLDNDDHRAYLLLKGRASVRRLIRLAGAICYVGALRRVVLADARKALDAALGADVMMFAFRNMAVAPRTMPSALPQNITLAVDRAGASCFAVWIKDWPEDYLSRVNIMLPALIWPAHVSLEQATYAPKIMEAVLGEVMRA